jgi:dihydroorotase
MPPLCPASQAPARIAGIAEPTIQPKRAADFCLIDPQASWQVTAAGLHSKSANSAWLGATLKCRVELTVAAGRLVWEAGA